MKLNQLTKCMIIGAGMMMSVTAFAQDAIKVGALLPLSGNYGFLGISERRGIDMAVEEINGAGGVLGKKVQILYEDAGVPAQAARKANQLLEKDKVSFLMVGGGSAVSTAIFEFAQRNKIVTLAIDPNAEELVTIKANKYSYLVPPPSSMIANSVVPEMAKIGKSVFFLTHDYSFGHTQTSEQRRVLKSFPQVKDVGEIKVPLNTRDFSSQLIALRNAKPDIVVVNVAGVDATALLQQIWEFQVHKDIKVVVPLLDFEDSWAIGAEKNTLIALAGVEWHYNVPVASAQEFKKKYQAKYPKVEYPVPTTNVVNAYLATRETLKAIERAGSTQSEKIVAALDDYVVKDSLKPNPMVIRKKDHQWVQDFFVYKTKKMADVKEPGDIYELISVSKGQDIVVPEKDRTQDLQ